MSGIAKVAEEAPKAAPRVPGWAHFVPVEDVAGALIAEATPDAEITIETTAD